MSFHGAIATFQIEVPTAGHEIRDTEFSQSPDIVHAPSIASTDRGGPRKPMSGGRVRALADQSYVAPRPV